MQKSTNYELNLPDLADQFNLNHWNENTEKLDLELKKETDSRINNDNQLQSNINNSVSTLRNEISTAETNAKNLANATGVLSIAKGGTGQTTLRNACNSFINALDTSTTTPQDDDFYVSQYVGGGTTNTSYIRRNMSALWTYIKSKNSFEIKFDSNHSRYVKIGSILISQGTVRYANLVLGIFANSKSANFPIGFVNINISSGNYATGFSINGFSSIPLNLTDTLNPRIIVNKTDKDYELYVDCSYAYLRVVVYENVTNGFTRGNFETYDSLSGTEVFNSTTSDKIVYLDGTATYATKADTATKLATTRTINIQDASATNTGTGASFDGSGNATIKLPTTIKANITGNCSGSSGSCTGNSATATNANNSYRGMVHTCSTASGTKAKTVSVTGFTLATGACIRVLFTNGNSVASPTLNVNNTGAKEIKSYNGKPLEFRYGSLSYGSYTWDSNTLLELYYNGTDWLCVNNPIVCNKEDEEKIGSVYLDGKKEQSGFFRGLSSAEDNSIRYHFNFDSLTYFLNVSCTQDNELGENRTMAFAKLKGITNNGFSCHTIRTFLSGDAVVKDDGNYCWLAIGY